MTTEEDEKLNLEGVILKHSFSLEPIKKIRPMENKETSPIKQATINKNLLFLNMAIKEIQKDTLKITALIETMGVDRTLFYVAHRMGYFTRHHVTKNKYKYKPTVKRFTFYDALKITEEANGLVANCKNKDKETETQTPNPSLPTMADIIEIQPNKILKESQMNTQPFVNTNNDNAPVTTKLSGKPIVESLPPIKFTHLQSETDEDLIAELKRRGYQGSIEIKKQVTL